VDPAVLAEAAGCRTQAAQDGGEQQGMEAGDHGVVVLQPDDVDALDHRQVSTRVFAGVVN
jgi:hypothetical protein